MNRPTDSSTSPEQQNRPVPAAPRHQRATGLPDFLFGAPYYPEHWTEQDMREDCDRMAAAGVNVVRMAEFAWDLMEPERDRFDFTLFDRTIERLAARGIKTILCTPTAAPPRWLTRNHEEWMRVDREGRTMLHGSRQHCCTNHPGFREESVRITQAMARHFSDNPHVIGWQTDNEFHCHLNECYCPACLNGFRDWLERKYTNIDHLNKAWGTAFWAQTYDAFADVPFPYPDRPTHANPAHQLDYYRFLSDSLTDFQAGQIHVLRAMNPQWWISHNGVFRHIDHWTFAEDLDFYGVDVYPGFAQRPGDSEPDATWAALKHEECRAASGNFVVFEQQGGAGGQHPYLLATPRPGQMRLWAWQAVAHGADGVLHFRWRTCRYGAEIYWNGILDHDNVPRRRYQEFADEGLEFKRLGPRLLKTVPKIDAAILIENDQDEAHASMPLGQAAPWDQRQNLYKALQQRHLACGLVNAADSFDGIQILFLPGFVLMDDQLAAKLDAFVEEGGVLVASARTGTRTRDNSVFASTPPGFLTTCFGLTVEEFGTQESLTFPVDDRNLPAESYYEILQPTNAPATAQVLSRWNGLSDGAPHSAQGQPALTVHGKGAGKAFYVGTLFGAENTGALLDAVLDAAPVDPLGEAAEAVEITCRHGNGERLLFLLNHSGQQQTIRNLPSGENLITGQATNSTITLSAYDVAVIRDGC